VASSPPSPAAPPSPTRATRESSVRTVHVMVIEVDIAIVILSGRASFPQMIVLRVCCRTAHVIEIERTHKRSQMMVLKFVCCPLPCSGVPLGCARARLVLDHPGEGLWPLSAQSSTPLVKNRTPHDWLSWGNA
jgi:hypothetical protein